MKKASDFFKLPINGQTLVDQYNTCGLNWVKATEEDDFIAHCVNHADALADALESILDSYESQQLCDSVLDAAKAALSAYRGEA